MVNESKPVSLQWPRPEIAPPSPEERERLEYIKKQRERMEEIRRRFGIMSQEKILNLFGMK